MCDVESGQRVMCNLTYTEVSSVSSKTTFQRPFQSDIFLFKKKIQKNNFQFQRSNKKAKEYVTLSELPQCIIPWLKFEMRDHKKQNFFASHEWNQLIELSTDYISSNKNEILC